MNINIVKEKNINYNILSFIFNNINIYKLMADKKYIKICNNRMNKKGKIKPLNAQCLFSG